MCSKRMTECVATDPLERTDGTLFNRLIYCFQKIPSRTKTATDRHDADAVAVDIQCDFLIISSPPENAILS